MKARQSESSTVPAFWDTSALLLLIYICVFRMRVGDRWRWGMSDAKLGTLEAELLATLKEFFGHAQSLMKAIADDTPESLIREFSMSMMTTEARATLHLARGSLALGYPEKASALAIRGLELAGERASILKAELKAVLDAASATDNPH